MRYGEIFYELKKNEISCNISHTFTVRGEGGKIFVDARICSDSWVKSCGQVMFKPHPSCTRRAMASSFEVEAMV